MVDHPDSRTAVMILAGILAVPLLACVLIVAADSGVKFKLIVDLALHVVVFMALTAGAFYFFLRNETHEDARR